ncbi:hypothetical protein D4Q71_23305 [Rhodopseudomonas palustris]|nr:hypothetical protein B1S06_18095 [Rhodopseudomonas palustris]RJF60449.1 hypothetical protein D4Q71_23305 [Rhodopseudomonas palustris]
MTIGAVALTGGAQSGATPDLKEHSEASPIPVVWIEFGRRVQDHIQKQLALESDAASRFHAALDSRSNEAGGVGPIVLRVWLTSDGGIDRVDLDGPFAESVRRDLTTAVAAAGIVGQVPAGMPQPLRMRLTLAPKPAAERQ